MDCSQSPLEFLSLTPELMRLAAPPASVPPTVTMHGHLSAIKEFGLERIRK